jgi:diguanylate cyclase (GGDEF)-like protein
MKKPLGTGWNCGAQIVSKDPSPMSHDTDHDLTVEISNTVPGRPGLINARAYLVHIYPPGLSLGTRYALGDTPVLLGRDIKADICIDDASVSRHHARFQPEGDGFCVVDLQSTNGTSVNKVPVKTKCKLKDGDDLRVGNCIYRFLASGNVEAQYHEEIHRLTIIDVLTHIPNRRYLLQFLERELLRSARYQRPLALVLFDIDHFKSVNDRFGHLGGDFTLRELAVCIQGCIRKEGLFARFGGEEFAVVLPEATLDIGKNVAERIRARVQSHPFQYEGTAFSISISLGVAATSGHEMVTPEELINQADGHLYQAKREGRNRVVAMATQFLRPHIDALDAATPVR